MTTTTPMATRSPQQGDLWRHVESNALYAVLHLATNKDPDGPHDGTVVYRKVFDAQEDWYYRTVEAFLASFTYVRRPETTERAPIDPDEPPEAA